MHGRERNLMIWLCVKAVGGQGRGMGRETSRWVKKREAVKSVRRKTVSGIRQVHKDCMETVFKTISRVAWKRGSKRRPRKKTDIWTNCVFECFLYLVYRLSAAGSRCVQAGHVEIRSVRRIHSIKLGTGLSTTRWYPGFLSDWSIAPSSRGSSTSDASWASSDSGSDAFSGIRFLFLSVNFSRPASARLFWFVLILILTSDGTI